MEGWGLDPKPYYGPPGYPIPKDAKFAEPIDDMTYNPQVDGYEDLLEKMRYVLRAPQACQ